MRLLLILLIGESKRIDMNEPILTIGRLLKQRVALTPSNNAIGWIENNEVKNLSFANYKTQVETLVNAFHKIGVNIGDKAAILAQTSKEWHFCDISLMCARACVIPIYPTYLAHEVEYIINHSDSTILILENDKQMEKIISVLPNLKNLKCIVSLNELSEDTLKKIRNSLPFYSYKDLIRIGTDEIKSQPDFFDHMVENQKPEELASIIYTSGTTGEPKGAVITQHSLVKMMYNVEATIKGAFSPSDRSLVFLPLSHVMGRADSLLNLKFGWQAVYAESMEKLVDNIQLVRPTLMMAVPRIFEKIYSKITQQINEGGTVKKHMFNWALSVSQKYFDKIDKDLSPSATEIIEYKLAYKIVFSKIYARFGGKIRYFVSGGAPLSADIIKFLRCANLTILEGYGLTETIAPCCVNPLSKQIPGTVGRPMGDVQISFGLDKEILIKSEAMLKEYYKNPTATAEAIQDGWFHTGDIGEFTAEGFLKITDRKKDIIITSGGKNVAPQKIENMAKTKPHISQIVVVGDRQKYLTAVIGIEKERFFKILPDLNLPTDCSLEDLTKNKQVNEIIEKEISELNQDLAQFETIKKFVIAKEEFNTDNFLTPSLKVKRKVVYAKYKSEIEAMYQ